MGTNPHGAIQNRCSTRPGDRGRRSGNDRQPQMLRFSRATTGGRCVDARSFVVRPEARRMACATSMCPAAGSRRGTKVRENNQFRFRAQSQADPGNVCQQQRRAVDWQHRPAAVGKTYEIRNRVVVCRACRQSANKPYCDMLAPRSNGATASKANPS